MRFVTYRGADGKAAAGLVREGRVLSLEPVGFPDLLTLIRGGEEALAAARRWLERAPESALTPLAEVQLLAPIPRPPKIICIGLNYRDHAAETVKTVEKIPTVFAKFPTAVIGPGANIVLPKASTKPDYEAELAFVLGTGGRYIQASEWRRHVFGYTAFNDVSARDFQMATTQWMIGKTFDTFAPMGPWIVTADEIPDPHALDISLTLNGAVMQRSNTSNLIFRIPDLIEFLSSVFTLEPGDVVATGTPSGVGVARKPPVFLKPGDQVTVRIAGVGELSNPVAAESG
ncbi:MAG: fumarylacetoacetate hydrolase family protein [Bryobacteraceae bacterium]|nr:fumarylacetoacetate hydrolase family protein [Bryobacteraceae bacterium]